MLLLSKVLFLKLMIKNTQLEILTTTSKVDQRKKYLGNTLNHLIIYITHFTHWLVFISDELF